MQAQDIRLNPQMMQSCRSDLPRFCGNVIQEHVTNQRELAKEIREEGAHREMLGRNQAHREKTARLFGELAIEFHGKVIHCLREQFVSNLGSKASEAAKGEQLSEACTSGLRAMMRESAVNYHLDPVLNDACDKEMQNHCAAQLENPTFLDLKRVGNVNEEDNGAGKSVSALRVRASRHFQRFYLSVVCMSEIGLKMLSRLPLKKFLRRANSHLFESTFTYLKSG